MANDQRPMTNDPRPTTNVWVGTSGYNYPEWKGSFYPKDLAQAKMLPYYAARFPTVEINYTFRRFPTEKSVETWSAAPPRTCRFSPKANHRTTPQVPVLTQIRPPSPLGEGLGVRGEPRTRSTN